MRAETSAPAPRVLAVAGETSGDHLLGPVIAALVARIGARCVGAGGDAARDAGLDLLAHVNAFSASGLVEAAPALPSVVRAYRRVAAELPRADVVLLVDSPELNLRLLRRAVALRKPVVWLAPPQAWAWRRGRAREVSTATRLACLMPFEADFYGQRGANVTLVGHPLAQASPLPAPTGRGLALLPGSRLSSVRRLFPLMLAAARPLLDAGTVDHLHLSVAPGLDPALFDDLLREHGLRARVHDSTRRALAASAVAVAGAGTTTLEALLCGRPLLTLGRLHPVSAAIARRLVRVPHLALPNLVLNRRAWPELWQEAASPAAIEQALGALLSPGLRDQAAVDAATLRLALDPDGRSFADRVADLLLEVLPGLGTRWLCTATAVRYHARPSCPQIPRSPACRPPQPS